MTYSILAYDAEQGLFGLAVASKFFAVGALCPWSGGPHGAAMSQALPNPELGHRALGLLAEGHRAPDVIAMLRVGWATKGLAHGRLESLPRRHGDAEVRQLAG